MTEHTLAGAQPGGADGLADLAASGVRVVRVLYPDLHGVARGKDVPVSVFAGAAEDGLNFCEAIMTVDLRHNVVSGFEHGFQDIVARPDLSTLVRIPWEPHVATCLADLERIATGEPYGVDARGALRRVLTGYAELGLAPIVAPELEFYLCQADEASPRGFRRYVANDSHVYTVGHRADPRGVLARMLDAAVELGLGAVAANHEFGRSQFEINLRHCPALESADRAFRFKALVKDMAAEEGLLATFMGKPWNDDEGSGFHLHMSLGDGDGSNLCADPDGTDGLSRLSRHLIAGLLEHGPALMAFFNPTVNAFRRITPEALVPTRVSWGHDNRLTLVRVPRERGRATRVELRVGDGTANPYLAYAAALAAGLDGIRRELEPPEPIVGMIYDLPEAEQGQALPTSFPEALEALDADATIRAAMGDELVDTFKAIKAVELARFRAWVTDWEFREYIHHLEHPGEGCLRLGEGRPSPSTPSRGCPRSADSVGRAQPALPAAAWGASIETTSARSAMAEWLDLTSADEVADGEMHPVTVRGLYLGVAHVGERWFVFDEECTHEQCPLPDGDLEGTVLTCGCHGSQFELSTGEVLTGPATEPIATYPVRIQDGRVQAELPEL